MIPLACDYSFASKTGQYSLRGTYMLTDFEEIYYDKSSKVRWEFAG